MFVHVVDSPCGARGRRSRCGVPSLGRVPIVVQSEAVNRNGAPPSRRRRWSRNRRHEATPRWPRTGWPRRDGLQGHRRWRRRLRAPGDTYGYDGGSEGVVLIDR